MTDTNEPDKREAKARLTRIRRKVKTARDAIAEVAKLLDAAKASDDWKTLGYKSWTAYIAAAFEGEPLDLPRDKRLELVAYLAGEGMSVHAVSKVTGTSQITAWRDIDRQHLVRPTVTALDGRQCVSTEVRNERRAKVVQLSAAGKSQSAIAKEIGVSPGTVENDLRVTRSPSTDHPESLKVTLRKSKERKEAERKSSGGLYFIEVLSGVQVARGKLRQLVKDLDGVTFKGEDRDVLCEAADQLVQLANAVRMAAGGEAVDWDAELADLTGGE